VPRMETDEFRRRDHFTERVRTIISDAVKEEFGNMEENGGNPLSFRVYITRQNRQGENFYLVNISWEAS